MKELIKKWWFWLIAVVIILIAVILVVIFVNPNNTANVKYTAEDIANRLKEKNPNIGRIVVYNEENDMNELLGRQGQYTSKVTFEDLRIEQSNKYLDPEYFSEEEINEPIGGTIEVFDNETDMKKRRDYVETISSSMSALVEYIYDEGVYLLRLNKSLTPQQAQEYENLFYEIVK